MTKVVSVYHLLIICTNSYVRVSVLLNGCFFNCCVDDPILISDDEVLEHKNIVVRRQLIRNEMVEIFQNCSILKYILDVTLIGNDGNPEKGEGRGVMLEMLSNFWQHVTIL